jgi:hypothetical protein
MHLDASVDLVRWRSGSRSQALALAVEGTVDVTFERRFMTSIAAGPWLRF